MQLSVPQANANEAPAAEVLTRDYHVYLKLLRAKFHDGVYKLDEKFVENRRANSFTVSIQSRVYPRPSQIIFLATWHLLVGE